MKANDSVVVTLNDWAEALDAKKQSPERLLVDFWDALECYLKDRSSDDLELRAIKVYSNGGMEVTVSETHEFEAIPEDVLDVLGPTDESPAQRLRSLMRTSSRKRVGKSARRKPTTTRAKK